MKNEKRARTHKASWAVTLRREPGMGVSPFALLGLWHDSWQVAALNDCKQNSRLLSCLNITSDNDSVTATQTPYLCGGPEIMGALLVNNSYYIGVEMSGGPQTYPWHESFKPQWSTLTFWFLVTFDCKRFYYTYFSEHIWHSCPDSSDNL